MTLAAIFDEFQLSPIILLTSVEPIVRRLLVLEGALALENKERSSFYEKNLAFMGLPAATSGKSLKHMS